MTMHHRRTRLVIERLEDRHLLAGNITAYVDSQQLILVGDAADNGVTLTYDSAAQKYTVTGRDAGGSPTTINGLDTSQPGNAVAFSGVKDLYVGLAAGNDAFDVGSPAAIDTVFARWMTIDMGDGDDTVMLGSAGNAADGGAPVARSLHVGTSISLTLGAGNDHLSIANAAIGLSLNVLAGDGDDHIDFDTEFTPSGATTPTVFPVTVQRNAMISLGGGSDELTMNDASIQGDLAVLDGAGAADITLSNINVKKSIGINTAGDADSIEIITVRAKQLSINTNGGVDQVHLNKTAFTTLSIKLGAGHDHLLINNTSTSFTAHLDGGADNAGFVGAANALHGLLRQHFG